jgi:hypothetical protein
MHKLPLHRPLGRISGLVVFTVGMGALVLAIALGANALFKRSFGPSAGGEAVFQEHAASAPAAASSGATQPGRTAP